MSAARILIVEDERIVALDLERRLRARGYDVDTAGGAGEAIAHAAAKPPDLVLMDIRLGDGDGIEVMTRIRDVADVPVVYVTAYADRATVERASFTEPSAYIVKPVDPKELDAAVHIALHRGAAERHRHELAAWQKLVIDVGAELVASLDAETIIRGVARVVVPTWTDVFAVLLNGERQGQARAVVVHPPGATTDPALLVEVQRTGVAVTQALPEPSSGTVRCTPLIAHAHRLGALAVGMRRRRAGPRLAPELVDDLGRRLAIALENGLLYRDARRAVAARDEMLSVVSHDLRNAVATVSLAAARLHRHDSDPAVEVITRSARHMLRLIGDLLDAKAIELGRLSLRRAPCDIAGLLELAISLTQPHATKGEVTLDVHGGEGTIVCDRDRIVQVLTNLLSNAVKHSPRGARVVLHADAGAAGVRIAVTDAGAGIPADELPHVFEYFWRSPRDRRGTGLGLYIAKAVIEAHGGRIGIESELGVGTTVWFTLPRSA